jgi:hypothetical protein
MIPSVKGSAFQSVADDVKRLIGEGVIDSGALDPSLRRVLEMPCTPLAWMPIASYGALLEVLAKTEGGLDPKEYLRRRGRAAAQRLLGGAYESFSAERGTWGRRTGESMLGIARMLYNFTTWSFAELPGEVHEVRVDGAEAFPEAARETAHGFLAEYAARAAGRAVAIESRRAAPDQIVYRIRVADGGAS